MCCLSTNSSVDNVNGKTLLKSSSRIVVDYILSVRELTSFYDQNECNVLQ